MMVNAVGASGGPTYIAPSTTTPPPQVETQPAAPQPPVTSPIPATTSTLAPSTVAALVTQQAADNGSSSSGSSSTSAASSSSQIAGTAAASSQGQWDYNALNQALAAVNDMSGKTSLSDQMSAYGMLANYANTGTDVGDTRKAIVNGWLNSPVTAQVQATLNQFSAAAWVGHGTSYSQYQQTRQSAFDGLSSDQQQMLYAGQGISGYASDSDSLESVGNSSPKAAAFVTPPPSGAAEALGTLTSISDQLAAGRAAANSGLLSLFEPRSGNTGGSIAQSNSNSATAKIPSA